jgi:hypothetical protein
MSFIPLCFYVAIFICVAKKNNRENKRVATLLLSCLNVRLHFRVRSINPIPIEGFSSNLAQMFTSTRGCAEPMLLMCQLKVKVIIEGQISNNQILDSMSCHSVSPTQIERFSSNLAEMFTSIRGCAELMFPMCQLKVKVTLEGQISNNQILDSMSCPLCKSYTN